jgi:hypothetical protein
MVGTLALQLKPPHNSNRGGSELRLIASARGCPAAGVKCPKSEQWKQAVERLLFGVLSRRFWQPARQQGSEHAINPGDTGRHHG